MQSDSRTATYARIGRSYPRVAAARPADGGHPERRRFPGRYAVAASLVAAIVALGLAGWLFAR